MLQHPTQQKDSQSAMVLLPLCPRPAMRQWSYNKLMEPWGIGHYTNQWRPIDVWWYWMFTSKRPTIMQWSLIKLVTSGIEAVTYSLHRPAINLPIGKPRDHYLCWTLSRQWPLFHCCKRPAIRRWSPFGSYSRAIGQPSVKLASDLSQCIFNVVQIDARPPMRQQSPIKPDVGRIVTMHSSSTLLDENLKVRVPN